MMVSIFTLEVSFSKSNPNNGECAYQGVRNVCFSGNSACFVFLLPPFWDSPFCLLQTNWLLILYFLKSMKTIFRDDRMNGNIFIKKDKLLDLWRPMSNLFDAVIMGVKKMSLKVTLWMQKRNVKHIPCSRLYVSQYIAYANNACHLRTLSRTYLVACYASCWKLTLPIWTK